MGINILGRSCYTNYKAVAPNPDPSQWELIKVKQYCNSYVMMVKYNGCTNFEGIKIIVYRGKYVNKPSFLDPHFQELCGPVARFRPDDNGWNLACSLAKSL